MRQRFDEFTKRRMIEDYLKSGRSKAEIWRQYTGREEEHGKIVHWMRQFGYLERTLPVGSLSLSIMPGNPTPQSSVEELQKRIKQLEQQLLDSQLKEEAYRRMIDIAEKELKVSIRKKPNTK
jgi:transposase-like protein